MSQFRVYYYIDGVETDIGVLFDDDDFPDGIGFDYNAFVYGISANDGANDGDIEVDVDSFRLGNTGYNSSQYFSDDFNSSGFTQWDYSPGSPTVLTETSGVARLDLFDNLPGNPGLELDPINDVFIYRNTYATWRVKVYEPSYPAPRSPAYFSLAAPSFYPQATFLVWNNKIQFEAGGYIDGGTTLGGDDVLIDYDLDDGEWHTFGIRFEIFDLPALVSNASLDSVEFRVNQ